MKTLLIAILIASAPLAALAGRTSDERWVKSRYPEANITSAKSGSGRIVYTVWLKKNRYRIHTDVTPELAWDGTRGFLQDYTSHGARVFREFDRHASAYLK